MKHRCNNQKARDYKYYGGKGVKVCDDWKFFEGFKQWAFNNNYEPGLQIDRIDSNGNYEPSNCRWISRTENIVRMNKERKGRIYRCTDEQAKEIINLLETTNKSFKEIGRITHTSYSRVRNINELVCFTHLHNHKDKIRKNRV